MNLCAKFPLLIAFYLVMVLIEFRKGCRTIPKDSRRNSEQYPMEMFEEFRALVCSQSNIQEILNIILSKELGLIIE